MKVIIYLVKDSNGKISYSSCNCNSDIIKINSNIEGENVYFESQGYNLEKWCKKLGLEYKTIIKKYNTYSTWINN